MSSVISAKGLEVKFSGCDALRGIDLDVPAGTVFALLGENGAGKTTLIRVLTGFQKPTAGSCSVLGMAPERDSLEIRRRVGYVSDAPALYEWMRVGEIGWFAASFYAGDYLERYRESIDRFELPEDRKIKHLSKGQRAKVALGLAIAHNPDLLILDEPTSGLDPLVRREFLESMLDRVATGRTVLLSSHHISEVERVADEVAILHQGLFRINDSLSELRESVSEVTISLEDPLTILPRLEAPAEVLQEQSEGRQRRLVVRNFQPAMQQQFEARPGVTSVHVRNATLDELFVACIRGESTPAPSDDPHSEQTKVA
ncbi:ABC transporter ATP-binding protein [Aureliella helgolandensis]|uniref:Daunorubicin/doxorubicin resistance ATP-binding protein DrrA n=1 Tax=Aureliella helgolandensis TaxID=2527968 RepID=A0A518GFV7_9BACT|nr:ABC transporter ATP-binding protein [Aureliella helgolandensis]QDV27484.1 Daunorubicin/doxorubicin resistance ATP-binding protein DrrA [Aureliella helgolandensis]